MSKPFLEGWTIAVSVSDSQDMPYLGLSERHLRDVMVEIARHLLSAGSTLIYGGDLRQHGFTELLFEVAARYHKPSGRRPAFTNMLPWPTHIGLTREEFAEREKELGENAELVRLARDGSSFRPEREFVSTPPREEDWAPALSAMRRRVTAQSQARIALGGAVQRYKGSMPGIAEEVLLALQAKRPAYVLGGFGGCAGDICEEMGLVQRQPGRRQWEMRDRFANASAESLHNGLTAEENRRLASSVHSDELVMLLLRGLHRLAGSESNGE